jgi:predicted glycogen debranching enzyme
MMTSEPLRIVPRPHDWLDGDNPPPRREWLVTNGLGGYASGTVAGVITRRYHGLLVSSLPAPLGRIVMLNHLLERVRLGDRRVLWLGDEDEVAGPNIVDRSEHLIEFRLELGMPVWRFALPGVVIEKRVLMPYDQNTVHVTYRMLEGQGPIRMSLRPSIQIRGYEDAVDQSMAESYKLIACGGGRLEVMGAGGAELPPLRLML